MSLNEAFNLNYKLIISKLLRYSSHAAAKSAAGVSVPINMMAALHACFRLFNAGAFVHLLSMVAQAGASKEAPVSIVSGNANPVWAATLEVSVSGGSDSSHTMEAALWLYPLLTSTYHPKTGYFIYNVSYSPVLRLFLWQGCFMHDYRPENSEEVLDHCRALINSIIEQNNLAFKEILTFVLWERIELLSKMLVGETTEEESHALLHF